MGNAIYWLFNSSIFYFISFISNFIIFNIFIMGAIKMIFDRLVNKFIRGHKYDSNYRYFKIIQDDGLEYEIEIHKDSVINQVGTWIREGIEFTEITPYDYYKDFNPKNTIK